MVDNLDDIVPLQLTRNFAVQGADMFTHPVDALTSFNRSVIKLNNSMQIVKLVSMPRFNLKTLHIDLFMDNDCISLLTHAIAKHVMPYLKHLTIGGMNGDIAIPLIGALQLGGGNVITLQVSFWCEEDAIFLIDLITKSEVCPKLSNLVVGPVSKKRRLPVSVYRSRRPDLKITYL